MTEEVKQEAPVAQPERQPRRARAEAPAPAPAQTEEKVEPKFTKKGNVTEVSHPAGDFTIETL